MAGMDYSVDYSISIATCQDAIRLVEHMLPYRGHQGLHVQDISAYAKPIIEQALNQLTQSTSLLSIGSLVRAAGTGASPLTPTYSLGKEQPYFSQLVHQHLRQFLSTYGITVDEVKVRVAPRDELMKALLSLKAFGLSEIDALHYYTNITSNLIEKILNRQQDDLEQNMHMIQQHRLDRYTDEMATIQAELESTRADFGLRVDTHTARLMELSRAISADLQASLPALNSVSHPDLQIVDRTGQFRVIGRGILTAPRPVEAGFAPESTGRRFSTPTSETHRV
jgi:hypothetical protein